MSFTASLSRNLCLTTCAKRLFRMGPLKPFPCYFHQKFAYLKPKGQLPSDLGNNFVVSTNYCTTMTSKMDSLLNDPRRHFDYETLISKKNDGAMLIIDVRQPEELVATGTIPSSINIPLNEVEDALAGMAPEAFRMKYGADKPSKGTLIVFSCQSGRRSVNALGKALFHGYLNAGNYKGGWLDWERHIKQQ